MNLKNKLKILCIAILFSVLPAISFAATFDTVVNKDNLAIGDTFIATVNIDSPDVSINAAQATLKFDPSILEVKTLNKTNSVFSFWLVDPTFSNTDGTVSFVGGATSGFTGKSLQVLQVTFHVKGTGTTNITYTDSAITASDGSGTNVLSANNGLTVQVAAASSASILNVQQQGRIAEIATNSPAKPIVKVPLYPDTTIWYNQSSDFSASWNLPSDITDVSVILNQVPDTQPSLSQGIFDNKTFKALSSGIYYLHVRFKNNIGWGVTDHYRIAIDNIPPTAFQVAITSMNPSNNPTPTISYSSQDKLSKIDYYLIQIDDQPGIKTTQTTFTTPPISPGNHILTVIAHDQAGNTSEGKISIDILPIEAPIILAITKDNFIGEGGIALNGASGPLDVLSINLKDSNGNSVYKTETTSSDKGFWSLVISYPLIKGEYTVEVVAQDVRGALSLPVQSEKINVAERPIITLFGLKINYFWFLIGVVFIFALAFFVGWFSRRLVAARRARTMFIVKRDVNNALNNIQKDILELVAIHKKENQLDPNLKVDIDFKLNKINEYINKIKNYLLDDIEEIE